MNWEISQSAVKPLDVDFSSAKYVYLHRNAHQVTVSDSDFSFDVWEYEECKLTKDEYAQLRIAQLENENTNLQLALTELYEELLQKG